jgi:hypothetical protein
MRADEALYLPPLSGQIETTGVLVWMVLELEAAVCNKRNE